MHTSNTTPEEGRAPSNNGSALLEPVELRDHTRANTAVSPDLLNQPLGEARIGMANAGMEEDIFSASIEQAKKEKAQTGGATHKTAGNAKAGPAPSNPDLVDLPPEKKREAAENLAKMLVDGYSRLNDFADRQLQISEKKILKLRSSGTIDMDAPLIPIDGGLMTFEETMRTLNEQNKGTITVDQEFKDDITPRLVNVLIKRGQGITDEQYLAGAVIYHAGMNMQKFFAMKSTVNALITFGQEMTKQRGGYSGAGDDSSYSEPPPGPSGPAAQAAPAPDPDPPPTPAAEGAYAGAAVPGTEQYKLREWGTAEKELARASRLYKKNLKQSGITGQAPASRQRVRKKHN